jgi:hypothetical protein
MLCRDRWCWIDLEVIERFCLTKHVDDNDDVFEWEVATVSRLNELTVFTTHTHTPTNNALEKDGDDDVFAWREDAKN